MNLSIATCHAGRRLVTFYGWPRRFRTGNGKLRQRTIQITKERSFCSNNWSNGDKIQSTTCARRRSPRVIDLGRRTTERRH